jgi:mannosyltransferase OCH1-like enzyme
MKEITANLFWVGALSIYEYKCIQSFVKQGFITHVWSYGDLELPSGVVQKDANLIMPESEFKSIKLNKKHNPACASDFFRIKLLIKEGGWWFDCDCFAMKSVEDFAKLTKKREIIIGNINQSNNINNSTIYCNNTDILVEILEVANSKLDSNNGLNAYLDAGRHSIKEVIKRRQLGNQVLRFRYFTPYPYNTSTKNNIINPAHCQHFKDSTANSFVFHFYNSEIDKSIKLTAPPDGSFIDYLFSTLEETT